MKEQSHKAEMSAALRGDFERLRERGVPVTLVPSTTPGPEPPPEVAADADTQPAAVPQAPPTPPVPVEARPAGDVPPDDDVGEPVAAETPDVSPPTDAPPAERRGWLSRFVGR